MLRAAREQILALPRARGIPLMLKWLQGVGRGVGTDGAGSLSRALAGSAMSCCCFAVRAVGFADSRHLSASWLEKHHLAPCIHDKMGLLQLGRRVGASLPFGGG